MSAPDLTPPEAARWAARSGLPLAPDRHAELASTAGHIHAAVSLLRELDGGEQHDAAV
ncbi:hypothetical protein [Streptomyces sp. WM6368]|uniref:hypothetical protein n=1 Tax=Streptomyces sp. WM6368 TaxID=1415554 RepID=UPI0006B0350E|nr:hypothetical protein [Streptomyces sp. WM6368]KOU35311.1 amidase [Streptomyces sp. WM6368]